MPVAHNARQLTRSLRSVSYAVEGDVLRHVFRHFAAAWWDFSTLQAGGRSMGAD